MGISVRYFVIDKGDNIKSISMAKFDRLYKGDPNEKYPEFSNLKVKFAEAYVEFEGRKPIRILQIEGSFLSFNSKGMLDQEELNKEMHAGVNATIQLKLPEKNDKIINAEQVFASKTFKNKYKWIPTEEIKQKIIKSIFATATI